MIIRLARDWVRHQPYAIQRLKALRVITGAALARSTWHLPPGDLLDKEAKMLAEIATPHPSPHLTPRQYEALRWVAIGSTVAWATGCDHWIVRLAANASSIAVHRQAAALWPNSWSYTTQLHLFQAVLSSSKDQHADNEENAARMLAFLQLCYSSVYLQAGVSKLRNTGWKWIDGQTLRGSWAESGVPLGRWLSTQDRRLAAVASAAALLLEIGFLPAVIASGRYRPLLGLASLTFHELVKATMGISFWHQSWFAVPLFLEPSSIRSFAAKARRADRKGRERARTAADHSNRRVRPVAR